MSEPCKYDKTIEMLLKLSETILSRVDDITGALGTVKVHDNELEHLNREQRTMWKRMDELQSLAAKAIETATAASHAAAHAAEAAASAAEAACKAQKRLDKIAATPGRLAVKYIGQIILLLTAAYIGSKFAA